jgi:hypothetical protein
MNCTVVLHLVAKRKMEVSKVTELYWILTAKKRHALTDKDILNLLSWLYVRFSCLCAVYLWQRAGKLLAR